MTDTGLSSTTGFSSTTCPSEENQHAPQPQPQEGTQETGGFTLTPNAPVFYGPSFGGFEKPPPYACWEPGVETSRLLAYVDGVWRMKTLNLRFKGLSPDDGVDDVEGVAVVCVCVNRV